MSSEDLSSEASVFYLSSEAIGFYLSLPKVLLKTCLRKLVSCNIYYKDYLKGGFASSVLIFQQSPSGLMKPKPLNVRSQSIYRTSDSVGKEHENGLNGVSVKQRLLSGDKAGKKERQKEVGEMLLERQWRKGSSSEGG
ncbi:hypothetical protein E3N88_28125 [Mikania micrantha]|uniref:Uncharacterized protein n=1 Tax=Mikania micrantha TaxID=192012 RepID=A0A5N6N082_9ASTR|nr:hypothetical protein E3N88_28125 [Mikania micrantha]